MLILVVVAEKPDDSFLGSHSGIQTRTRIIVFFLGSSVTESFAAESSCRINGTSSSTHSFLFSLLSCNLSGLCFSLLSNERNVAFNMVLLPVKKRFDIAAVYKLESTDPRFTLAFTIYWLQCSTAYTRIFDGLLRVRE